MLAPKAYASSAPYPARLRAHLLSTVIFDPNLLVSCYIKVFLSDVDAPRKWLRIRGALNLFMQLFLYSISFDSEWKIEFLWNRPKNERAR